MMTELDDRQLDALLRSFRTPVPEPSPTLEERIAARVRTAPRPRRRRSMRLRLIAVPAAVAAAATLVVALLPGAEQRPGVTGILARAEAAVTVPDRILALDIVVSAIFHGGHSAGTDSRLPGDNARTTTYEFHEWTLTGAGRAMAARFFVSERGLDEPPTEEDTALVLDRDGRVIDQRAWMPQGDGDGGELRLGGHVPEVGAGTPSMVGRLREAYRREWLKPAGRTADGSLRLRGWLEGRELGCGDDTVILDPDTFIPRRIVTIQRNIAGSPDACAKSVPTGRTVLTVRTARRLPATTANRRLLRIGDWPIDRVLRDRGDGRDPEPLDRIPPVPPLDEG